MRALHGVEQVRAAEAALMATVPEGALMQRAAAGLARRAAALLGRCYGARVVLLVGTGDNGGDALFAGARLAERGARVDALLAGDRCHEAGLAALRRAGGRGRRAGADGDRPLLAAADLVVDGLLGIGGHGGLRPGAARLAELTERGGATVLAVDLPSGVDADTGRVEGAAVRADVTVTFGVTKPGLVVSPGAQHAGTVECVDIGLGGHLPEPAAVVLDADDVARLLPLPRGETSKYGRGVLGLAAGSDTFTGAAVLAAGGALAAGAGMVRFAGAAHPAELVRHRWPEVVVTAVPPGDAQAVLAAGRVQAWAVGSGLGTGEDAGQVVEALLATDLPVVVDADAVTVLADHHDWLTGRRAPTLLTPHAGELARLMATDRADVEADRLTWARRTAGALGVTVLLKGTTTVVADPARGVRVNPTGTPWLATAGSGDVLTGAAGALLAQGLPPLEAGAVAAFVHGLAARLAARTGEVAAPVHALQLVSAWSDAVRALRRGGADG